MVEVAQTLIAGLANELLLFLLGFGQTVFFRPVGKNTGGEVLLLLSLGDGR